MSRSLCDPLDRQAATHARTTPLPAALVGDLLPACYIVKDCDGQALAYIYFEDDPGRRAAASPP